MICTVTSSLLIWKFDSCSDFLNIFDVNWFISFLAKDVTIIKRVPERVMRSMEKPPYTMRVPRKSEPAYYLDQVLPILLRRRVSSISNMFMKHKTLMPMHRTTYESTLSMSNFM